MKKLTVVFSVLAAFLAMGALSAFAGTGPYGFYGPAIGFETGQGSEVQHVAFAGGTGPYGSFGPTPDYNIVPGSEARHVASYVGSGPYGAFSPSGMVGETEMQGTHFANKDECLLVAMNCPKDFSTQQKIDRLNTEISKGTSVYTPEELNSLKSERDQAYKDLGGMNQGY